MICELCGIKEASGNGVLCDKCLKESIEDKIEINNWIADGHTQHCAYRLVWGDGECECRRQQNWLTPKPTTATGKAIVNFDCPELHDYNKEEALLTVHAFFSKLEELETDVFRNFNIKQEYLGKEFSDILYNNLDKLYETDLKKEK